MRDRLIELIQFAEIDFATVKNMHKSSAEVIADHLLKNGVIVCEMDNDILDTAKVIFEEWNNTTGVVPERTSWYWELESVIEDIVKLSFGAGVLYKAEAEASLKARENDAN